MGLAAPPGLAQTLTLSPNPIIMGAGVAVGSAGLGFSDHSVATATAAAAPAAELDVVANMDDADDPAAGQSAVEAPGGGGVHFSQEQIFSQPSQSGVRFGADVPLHSHAPAQVHEGSALDQESEDYETRMRLGSDWNAAGCVDEDEGEGEGEDDAEGFDEEEEEEDDDEAGSEVRMRMGSEWCDHREVGEHETAAVDNSQGQGQGQTVSRTSAPTADETRAPEPDAVAGSAGGGGAVPPPSQTKPSFRHTWLGRKTT